MALLAECTRLHFEELVTAVENKELLVKERQSNTIWKQKRCFFYSQKKEKFVH